jgi:hypothetical protein
VAIRAVRLWSKRMSEPSWLRLGGTFQRQQQEHVCTVMGKGGLARCSLIEATNLSRAHRWRLAGQAGQGSKHRRCARVSD